MVVSYKLKIRTKTRLYSGLCVYLPRYRYSPPYSSTKERKEKEKVSVCVREREREWKNSATIHYVYTQLKHLLMILAHIVIRLYKKH